MLEQPTQQVEAIPRTFESVPGDRCFTQPHRCLQILAGAQQDVFGQALRLAPVGDLEFGLPISLRKARIIRASRLANAIELIGEMCIRDRTPSVQAGACSS